MNTPIGKGQTFTIPSSVGGDIRSSISFKPRAALKKSATTDNVTNSILMHSDSSDPPSTIIKSVQKRFKEFGSDERKIISGFLSTPLLVIKTPGGVRPCSSSKKDLPRSPLQKITTKKSSLFQSEGSSLLVRETSSIEESLSLKSNETNFIEETFKESAISSTDCSVPNTSILNTSDLVKSANEKEHVKEHENFQASITSRILEERKRIETQAMAQARKLQKIKAGPTNLPVKSTKPLTIPRGFPLKSDERAQLKKSNSISNTKTTIPPSLKVSKPPIAQKFVPTIPKSPLFASKLRAATKSSNTNTTNNNIIVTENKENVNASNTNDLRRKLEFRPLTKPNTTIPKSPKLSSIHRNRPINNSNNKVNK